MPPARRRSPLPPPEPARVDAPPSELPAEEADLVATFWGSEQLPAPPRAPRKAILRSYDVAREWGRMQDIHEAGWILPSHPQAQRLNAVLDRLRKRGYLRSPSPESRYDPTFSLTDAGRAAVADDLPRWWAREGVIRQAATESRQKMPPAAVVATFARVLATADGMVVGSTGRPGARAQRELLACLPREDSAASRASAADDDSEDADEDGPPMVRGWPGFPPRLAPWLAAAAYWGLIQRSQNAAGQAVWAAPTVDEWLGRDPGAQWLDLVRAWSAAAAASPLGALLLGAPPGSWLSPAGLLAWLRRYVPWTSGWHGFVRDVVVGGGAQFGVLALTTAPATEHGASRARSAAPASDEVLIALTDAGRQALEGKAPAVAGRPDPVRVGGDFTVIEPLGSHPWTAWALRRVAAIEGVDQVVTHRLTREAWLAARERGDDPALLWEDAGVPSKAVPQNVAFTLDHDWSDAGRSASLEQVVLLRFPAAEVAAHARRDAALRRAVAEELSPTAWVLRSGTEAAARQSLRRLGLATAAAGEASQPSAGAAPAAKGRKASAPRDKASDKPSRSRRADAPTAAAMSDFRLTWPGPFGAPTSATLPVPLHRPGSVTAPVPSALVRMPPAALYRRLWMAMKNGETVWIETESEGIVRFRPEYVTRRSLHGTCEGCGDTHVLDLGEVRGMLDEQAIAERS